MMSKVLLSCLLISASLATIPQVIQSSVATDITTTVTVSLSATTTETNSNGQQLLCALGYAPLPVTGQQVHLDFRAPTSLDFFIVTQASLLSFLYIGEPNSGSCSGFLSQNPNSYFFMRLGVTSGHYDATLPAAGEQHYILVIHCCSEVNGLYAAVVADGDPLTVSIIPLSQFSISAHTFITTYTYPTTISQATTFSHPTDQVMQQLGLIVGLVAAGALCILLLFSRTRQKYAHSEKSLQTKGFCVECGKALPVGSKTCSSCGTKQP